MTAMRDVWGEKLVQLGESDPRTVVLDGDLANSTKADNWSSKPNVNPYTGKAGTVDPYKPSATP